MSSKYDFSDFEQPVSQYDFSDFDSDNKVSQLESGLRGVAQGVSLGFADELIGGAQALSDIALTDKQFSDLEDLYLKHRDESRKNNEVARNENPGSFMTGEIGGSLATAALPGFGILNAGKGATLGTKIGLGALQGGLSSAGLSEAENMQDFSKDVLSGAAIGGAVPVALEGISKGASTITNRLIKPGLAKAADYTDNVLLPKFGRTMNNVPEEYTKEYLKSGGKLAARESEEIMDDLVGYYNKASTGLDDADFNFNKAKDYLSEIKNKARNELVDTKFDTQNLLSEAKDSFSNKVTAEKEALKNWNLQNLGESVSDSIEKLKRKVSTGSTEAYKSLDKVRGSIDLYAPLRELNDGLKSLEINGQTVSDSATQSYQNLSKLKERLSGLDRITLSQAKQILQQLDDDIKTAAAKGSFMPEADAIKANVRKALDSSLKSINPEYKQIMEEVADNTRLLQELSSGFGTDVKRINRLSGLATEKGRQIDLPLLQRLGQKTGQNWDEQLQEFISKQDLINSPTNFQKYTEGFDEFKNLEELRNYYNQLRNPENIRSIEELGDVQKAMRNLDSAESALSSAKTEHSLFRNVSPEQVQSKVKALTGARNYGANEVFEQIDQKTGKNFSQEILNREVLNSFQNADTNGSRKTLLGAVLGKAAGSAVGAATGYAVGDDYGAGVGAVAGFSLDRYAGQVFKKMLDGRISSQEFSRTLAPKLGKFAAPLQQALQNGNQSLAATMFILQQNHPEFRQKMKEIEGSEK